MIAYYILVSSETLATAGNLRRGLTRLNRRLRLESRILGLTAAKHSILGHLFQDGPKTPKALARAEGLQPQSLTRVLAELEESHLVLRTQDESDHRQFKLEITSQGRDLLIRDARNRASWLAAAMESSLTVLERDVLRLSIQVLDKLGNAPAPSEVQDTGATPHSPNSISDLALPVSMTRLILFVRDVARLQSFYQEHFGFRVVEEIDKEWTVLMAGHIELALHLVGQPFRTAPTASIPSNAKLVFTVDSGLAELRTKLESAGVSVGEVKRYPGFAYSLCDGQDPEGNVFQLSQPD